MSKRRLLFAAPALLLALASCEGDGMMDRTGMMSRSGTMSWTGSTAMMSVSPRGDATGVSVDAPIVMRFNHSMGAGMEMLVYLHEGDVDGPVVEMDRSWSSDRTTLTCTPTSPLKSKTRYTVHMGGGMVDSQGHVIDWDDMPMFGGHWLMPGMMSGSLPGYMMGPGWRGTNGSYGAVLSFTTA